MFTPKCHVEIDAAALRSNYAKILAAADGAAVYCVVKADAYGHGASLCVRELLSAGADRFAVSNSAEAAEVRAIAPDAEILILGWTPPEDAADLALANITQTAADATHTAALALAVADAKDAGRLPRDAHLRIHIKVDTGMNRIGYRPDGDFALPNGAEDHLLVTGAFTHLPCADEESHDSVTAAAITAFASAAEKIKASLQYIDSYSEHGEVTTTYNNTPSKNLESSPTSIPFTVLDSHNGIKFPSAGVQATNTPSVSPDSAPTFIPFTVSDSHDGIKFPGVGAQATNTPPQKSEEPVSPPDNLIQHAENSAALLRRAEIAAHGCDVRLGAVRAGIILYGLPPAPALEGLCRDMGLRPVMNFRSLVSHLHTVRAGESIGYGATFTADADILVATVPAGYADGVPRAFNGCVMIDNVRCRVLGRVCMDQLMVDASAVSDVRVGDTVTLFGVNPDRVYADADAKSDKNITADDFADACGTINYEIVTRIGQRVPRVLISDT